MKNALIMLADEKAPDVRPQGPREPERTVAVREDSRGAENASDHLALPVRARGFGGHVRTFGFIRSGPPIQIFGLFQHPAKTIKHNG